MTLVRNNGNLCRWPRPTQACFVVMPESRFSTEGQAFTQEVRKRLPRASADDAGSRACRAQQIDDALEPADRLRRLRGRGVRSGDRLARLGRDSAANCRTPSKR